MDTKQIINKKVEYWKKKLIDLSKRNKISFSAEKDYMCEALTPLLINIDRRK